MNEIKFRGYSKASGKMYRWEELLKLNAHTIFKMLQPELKLMQYTGLKDKNDIEIYEGDVLEFENGDKVFIDREDWVEFFVETIGESEYEDQWRDFYRISKAKIIGNIHENPELLK